MPLVLNMPGFEYTRVPNMLGLHRVLNIRAYFLGMSFTLFNQFGTKVISKNVILPPRKALRTRLKLSRKVEYCYASACIRKKSVSLNSMGHVLHAGFL